MKYIINNTKLNELITKHITDYLDGKVNNNLSRVDSFIIIHRDVDDGDDEPISLEYDNFDGRLYINKDFLNEFRTWFPMGDDESSKELIKNWFESKFPVEVKFVSS